MLANNLKKLRKEKRLTLEEIATALGTSRQTIYKYENGIISNIPTEKIELLAELFGVTPARLMGWGADAKSYADMGIMSISTKKLPILGSIACGEPIYASEEHESFAAADENIDADFCLRANGDSMTVILFLFARRTRLTTERLRR